MTAPRRHYNYPISHQDCRFKKEGLPDKTKAPKKLPVNGAASVLASFEQSQWFSGSTKFKLQRARIPTSFFKTILGDMDLMSIQYGTHLAHEHVEEMSRYIAPIFNHILALFEFAIKNRHERIVKGRGSTKNVIEHHIRMFGGISVLKVDAMLGLFSPPERSEAIARIVTEAQGCHKKNKYLGFSMPILCILNGDGYLEFFSFDGNTVTPTFARGILPSGQDRLYFHHIASADARKNFIKSVRPVCETVLFALLQSYCETLKACSKKDPLKAEVWKDSEHQAKNALAKATEAADLAQGGDFDDADRLAEEGLEMLKNSIKLAACPISRKVSLLECWDEEDAKTY